jgi:hypothetical protein
VRSLNGVGSPIGMVVQSQKFGACRYFGPIVDLQNGDGASAKRLVDERNGLRCPDGEKVEVWTNAPFMGTRSQCGSEQSAGHK